MNKDISIRHIEENGRKWVDVVDVRNAIAAISTEEGISAHNVKELTQLLLKVSGQRL